MIRVLHSFPHKIGAARICTTAWHEVADVAAAGGNVTVHPGAVARPLPPNVSVRPTLARGRIRIPYRPLGEHALALHDRIVAQRLTQLVDEVDLVHVWPLGATRTMQTARRLGIPTVMERPNAHTRFAYEVVARECARLGVDLPPNHEHAYNASRLAKEEIDYKLADRLLCPSDFVAATFRDEGFTDASLVRHQYGFDEAIYSPEARSAPESGGLNALFVGVCAVRKGVHFALEAWLQSTASKTGTFRIAGDFVPEYRARLEHLLGHPSVQVLGHSNDVPGLMRRSDILMLPTIEEGSPLVCAESMASGCVPLVSEICTEMVVHDRTGLKHSVGDVDTLAGHIELVDRDRALLDRMRNAGLADAGQYTWAMAGIRLLEVYRQVVEETSAASSVAA